MGNWYPLAQRQSGPADKQGYTGTGQRTEKEGAICHSMVGSYEAAKRELMNPARRASWTFSILKDGRVMQHYGIRSVAWHGGSQPANERFAGIEHEGGFDPHDEPLTPMQVKSLTDLLAWLGDEFGWTEWKRLVTLWEHNEMTRFGSGPTACPSGRIPWTSLISSLEAGQEQGDEPMTDEERRAFDELKAKTSKIAAQQRAGGIFATIAGKALQGEQPSAEDKNQARFLLG